MTTKPEDPVRGTGLDPARASAAGEQGGGEQGGGDEAHLAALLAVITLVRADEARHGTPLQQWRARRLAALARDTGRPR